MAIVVTSQNFEEEVTKSSLPVVIDFFAPWCGPCKQMGPVFDELSNEYADKYKFVKINIDEDRDLAVQHSVSSIPTFVFIKDGNVVAKETGSMNKDALKAHVTNHLG